EIVSNDYGTAIQTLNPSYRCPSTVIALANKLITRNNFRASKETIAHSSAKAGKVTVVQWPSLDAEIDDLAELVHHRITVDQLRPGDILILCPAASMATKLINVLDTKHAT